MDLSNLPREQRVVTRLDSRRMSITFPDSSAISHAVYNDLSQDLAIRYSSGGEYVYSEVSPRHVLRLLISDSAGGFVNTFIKGAHASRRIDATVGVIARMAGAV